MNRQAGSLERVGGLGADRVVAGGIDELPMGDGADDVVIDAVGKSTFGRCRRLLAPRGRHLSTELGPWSQNLGLALVTPLLRARRVTFPFRRQDQRMVQDLRDLIRPIGSTGGTRWTGSSTPTATSRPARGSVSVVIDVVPA